jgi:cytidylate kinase
VFEKELIRKVIDEHKFPEQYNKYFSESSISTVQDIMGELLDVSPPRETLVRKMSETIFHLAQVGYVILVGRGANIITRRLPKGVHVRLVGSFERRVAHIQEYLEIGEKEARDYIIKEDFDRKEFIKQYFYKDINDASLYDIVINLDTVPLEDAVMIIGDLIFKGKEKLKET